MQNLLDYNGVLLTLGTSAIPLEETEFTSEDVTSVILFFENNRFDGFLFNFDGSELDSNFRESDS